MSRTDWVPWQLQDVHFLVAGSQHDQVLHWQDWLGFWQTCTGRETRSCFGQQFWWKGWSGWSVTERKMLSKTLSLSSNPLDPRFSWWASMRTQRLYCARSWRRLTREWVCTCTPGGRKSSTTKGLTQNKTVRNDLINLFERSPDHELETYFEQTFPATPLPKLTTSLVVARMIRWAYLIILSFLFQGFKFWVIFCWREKWKMHI